MQASWSLNVNAASKANAFHVVKTEERGWHTTLEATESAQDTGNALPGLLLGPIVGTQIGDPIGGPHDPLVVTPGPDLSEQAAGFDRNAVLQPDPNFRCA
jgi:hypothetical protein